MNGNDEVTQFLPYATWRSLDNADAWFQRMQNLQATGTALQFVVIDKSSEKAVGTCLLFKFDERSARAELGYVLAQAYWHKGYMQEALRGLIHCAFSSMGLRRLEAEVNPQNEASTRLLQSIGFTKEGVLRQRWVGKDEPYDVAIYGLLKHEYIF
jgi:[ribosomal protein S5]-alanine N-acetyltransferase